MARQPIPSDPRKRPVQSRSTATVDAILEAAVRILEAGHAAAFTTKRVAELAGVSVGSLYQYFPNKQSLVSELVGRRLTRLVAVTRAACEQAPAGVTAALAHVIERIMVDKRSDPRWWRALAVVTETVDVHVLVRRHTEAIHAAIADLVAARLGRALTPPERSRLAVAIDAVEGALSRMVKSAPARLHEDGMSETLTRLVVATLDLEPTA